MKRNLFLRRDSGCDQNATKSACVYKYNIGIATQLIIIVSEKCDSKKYNNAKIVGVFLKDW